MQFSLYLYLRGIGIHPCGIPWNIDNAPQEEKDQWIKFAAEFSAARTQNLKPQEGM